MLYYTLLLYNVIEVELSNQSFIFRKIEKSKYTGKRNHLKFSFLWWNKLIVLSFQRCSVQVNTLKPVCRGPSTGIWWYCFLRQGKLREYKLSCHMVVNYSLTREILSFRNTEIWIWILVPGWVTLHILTNHSVIIVIDSYKIPITQEVKPNTEWKLVNSSDLAHK